MKDPKAAATVIGHHAAFAITPAAQVDVDRHTPSLPRTRCASAAGCGS